MEMSQRCELRRLALLESRNDRPKILPPLKTGLSSGKLRLGFYSEGGEARAVTGTNLTIIGVSLLASGAGLHRRVYGYPVGRITRS